MALPKRVKWSQLDPGLRTQLLDILAAHRTHQAPLAARFHSHADEFFGFLLLAFLSAAIGAIASAVLVMQHTPYEGEPTFFERWQYFPRAPISTLRLLITDDMSRTMLLVIVSLVLLVIGLRHYNRRGLAITEDAIIVLRGPRVRVLPFSAIASASPSSHGTRGRRFTVLEVTLKEGGKLNLYTTKVWADAALAQMTASAPAQ